MNKAASSVGQSRIPEYFKCLNEIQIIAARNRQLEEALHLIHIEIRSNLEITSTTSSNTMSLLYLLANSAQKNTDKKMATGTMIH